MRAFSRRVWRAFTRVLGWILLLTYSYLLIASIAYGVPWAISEDTVDRRLAALADVAAGGGFLLAALGVLVALLAFGLSIRRPKLALNVRLGDGMQNHVATLFRR